MPDRAANDRLFFTGIAQMILDMQRGRAGSEHVPGAGLEPELAALRAWQSERLKRTYADLLADERFRPACRFFLRDIYAPTDFSQRDQDAESIYRLASRYLPAEMLRLFNDVIWLNKFTAALDQALLDALVEKLEIPLAAGGTAALTAELYAEGYRVCDNFEARKLQIDLLVRVILDIGRDIRNPLIGVTLRAAALPAHLAGWGALHGFATRGVQAFRHMRKPHAFASTVQEREMRILHRIFEKQPEPFA